MGRRPSRRGALSWSEVRVGIVLIFGLLILLYAIFQVGRLFNLFTRRYELIVLAPTAAGLIEGAPVTVAGRRVGQVEEIELVPMGQKLGNNNIRVRISLERAVQEQIRADSRAQIRIQGLLGDKFIDIEPGSATQPRLEPGDSLIASPPTDFDRILATTDQTLSEARVAVQDLRRMTSSIQRGEGTLGRLVTDETLYIRATLAFTELHLTLETINRSDGTLARLIRDPEAYQRFRSAVARLDSIAAAVLHSDGTLARLVHSDELYLRMLGTIGKADSAIAGLSDLLTRVTAGDGTLHRLLNDPELYDQLLEAIVDLQTLINDIRQNPRRYRPEMNIDVF